MKKKKVLIIRFNSIGDIVLTSPVIRALDGEGYEVHYLSKKAYQSLLLNNPRVAKHFAFDDNMVAIINQLKSEKYSYVIDLHNNYRSRKVCRGLGIQSFTLAKHRVELFMMTKFQIGMKQQEHIVDRFLDVVFPLLSNESKGQVEFYIPNEAKVKVDSLSLPENYISLSVGAAFFTKQIPTALLSNVIKDINVSIVLLGGKEDIPKAKALRDNHTTKIIDLCGALNIEESAEVIRRSKVLLSGDTGLKHIAASLDVAIVAVYGSTHPVLGYTPYYNHISKALLVENKNLKCRPCTKQGRDACPKGHFKCMKELDSVEIIDKIHSFI